MARRGGFGGMGMPGNMNNLMKQAQRMQRQMEENKKALDEKEFKATAGGGAVEVVMTGSHQMKSITIDPDAADPDDVETLQDMILVAVNDVWVQIEEGEQQAYGRNGRIWDSEPRLSFRGPSPGTKRSAFVISDQSIFRSIILESDMRNECRKDRKTLIRKSFPYQRECVTKSEEMTWSYTVDISTD